MKKKNPLTFWVRNPREEMFRFFLSCKDVILQLIEIILEEAGDRGYP